ncbi:MAG TPA: ferredoxin [Salinivirga sp.]|uniref:ferredoxin n=1 Tax=Salinivirga sp. TaxID=1970192 RepID=UPI002B470AEA|nr:ferredoxin [Salinivirga sp.]HKK60353.1 ferredoxin [Salinivirga sp.]
MAINKVWIEEGCTSCGLCEDVCPDVFKVEDEAEVIEGADFNANEDCIKEAAEECPVEVIKFE